MLTKIKKNIKEKEIQVSKLKKKKKRIHQIFQKPFIITKTS